MILMTLALSLLVMLAPTGRVTTGAVVLQPVATPSPAPVMRPLDVNGPYGDGSGSGPIPTPPPGG